MPDNPTPLVLSVFSTFKVGGPQRRFAAMANAFGRRYRHEVTAMDGNYHAATLLDQDLLYRRRDFPAAKTGLRRTWFAARAVIKDLRPDVLVTNNWGAIEWAAANLPPIVRQVHIEDGFGPEEAAGQLRRRVWFRRLVLGWNGIVVLPSMTLLKIARDEWRLPEHRLNYVPNGITCAKYDRRPDPARLADIRGHGPIIGTVAALRAEKALGRLIHAFSIVRQNGPARLVIVGEGQERAALETLAGSLGLSEDVTFLGHIDKPEEILPAFDVFALSSDTEQMPLTVLEAMAAGLPIAGVDVGDVKHMVAPENRSLIGPVDHAALASTLAELITSPERRRAIGGANRTRVRAEYDFDRMLATYDRLFTGTP